MARIAFVLALSALVLAIVALLQAAPSVTSVGPGGPPGGSPGVAAGLGYVQAFGAKCDGKSNDAAAFQHADANSTGAIAVPPGVCVIGTSATSPINWSCPQEPCSRSLRARHSRS